MLILYAMHADKQTIFPLSLFSRNNFQVEFTTNENTIALNIHLNITQQQQC